MLMKLGVTVIQYSTDRFSITGQIEKEIVSLFIHDNFFINPVDRTKAVADFVKQAYTSAIVRRGLPEEIILLALEYSFIFNCSGSVSSVKLYSEQFLICYHPLCNRQQKTNCKEEQARRMFQAALPEF
ncbi:hypothetical protein ACTXT7_003217 [Hymenolepis weldensis]